MNETRRTLYCGHCEKKTTFEEKLNAFNENAFVCNCCNYIVSCEELERQKRIQKAKVYG